MTVREILAAEYLEERVEKLGRRLLEISVTSDEYTEVLLEIDRLLAILNLDLEHRPALRLVKGGRPAGESHG